MKNLVRRRVDYWVKNEVLCEFLRKYLAMGMYFQVEVLLCEKKCTLLRCYFRDAENGGAGGEE